jgi:hypothetical protein
MKQKDIALIAIIVIVSAIVSLFVSKDIFSSNSSQQQVESVQPIDSEFPTKPNNAYFNGGFDPTQLIQIGPNNNNNPFNSSSQ